MKRLKTLHIDSEKVWGGGQRQVAGLITYLRDWGHEAKLVCRPGSRLETWARGNDVESIAVEMRSALSQGAMFALRSVIARERPDVVHLHTSRAHVLGAMAARLTGTRVVIATRRMDDPIKMVWPNTSAYGKWTSAIVAISSAVRDAMIRCGVDPAKIRLIPSGTDIDRFENAAADLGLRSRLGIDAGVPLVCVAAALAERKGIRYLIEAAALLNAKGAPVHLVIAGEGDLRDELERLARDLGVGASFVGFYDDMPTLLASVDVFAMPSTSEGLGVAVLEAMAAARPVVASAVGGLKESVVDGVTGLLVSPADAHALAEGIGKLISNPSVAGRFGSAGRARVRENFSLENMARLNEALYFELVSSSKGYVHRESTKAGKHEKGI
jgi:glycosyltransferase involved in cell wall biosynthesis